MKIRNWSYPTFLMGVVLAVNLLTALVSNGLRIFLNPINLILYNAEALVLFILLYRAKMDNSKPIAIASIVFGALSLVDIIQSIPYLLSGEFFDLLLYGSLKNVLFSVAKCSMYFILGINLLRQKKIPKSYSVIFGIAAFLVLYGSVLMAVARPTAILSELPDFLFIMAIWYTPRLFDENKVNTTAITPGKLKVVVGLVIAMFVLLMIAGGIANSGSSRRSDIARDPNGFMGYSDDFWDWYYENQWTK